MNKALRIVVSVLLLGWLAWRMDWHQIRDTFAHLRLELWFAAVVLYLATQVISARRWQMLAEPLGFRPSLWQTIAFYFIGMFFNLLLPTSVGGDVVRAWYLDGSSGRRLGAFVSVVVDRLSGLIVLLGLACAATLFCPGGVPVWIPISVWVTAGGALLGLVSLPALVRRTERLEKLRRLVAATRIYLQESQLVVKSTGLSVLVQAANVVVVWLVGAALGAPVPATYYWVIVPMVTLLTMLPLSLNGMGVREGGMALFLAPLGISEATAVSLAFLWFSVFTVTSLAGAGIYVLGRFRRPEERNAYGSVRHHPDQGRTRQLKAAA